MRQLLMSGPHETPRRPPEDSRRPQETPRRPQELPGDPQETPRKPQETPGDPRIEAFFFTGPGLRGGGWGCEGVHPPHGRNMSAVGAP